MSNLKKISKMSTLTPFLEKFLRTPRVTFTISTSFDVQASQAKLTIRVARHLLRKKSNQVSKKAKSGKKANC